MTDSSRFGIITPSGSGAFTVSCGLCSFVGTSPNREKAHEKLYRHMAKGCR